MSIGTRVGVVGLALASSLGWGTTEVVPAATPDPVAGAARAAAFTFEANHGQFDSAVRFVSRARGYTLFLTDAEAVFALGPGGGSASGRSLAPVIRLSLDRARAGGGAGVEQLPGIVNYLIGRDRTRWRTGIPTYSKVAFDDVYPGIDLVYYGRDGLHEYDLVVAPGADPSQIALRVTGATPTLEPGGDLALATAAGTMTMRAPLVYQAVNGDRQQIPAAFSLASNGAVMFELGLYDVAAPLVIDPQIVYGTYLGGSGNGVDQARGIALDASGAAYIVGSTEALDYPIELPFQAERKGRSDAVVTKLSPDGSQVIYSTYLGGTSFDTGTDITVRDDGVAYVIGDTSSSDFPLHGGGQGDYRGSSDVFVAALNDRGTSLVAATLLGGSDVEGAGGVRLAKFARDPVTPDPTLPVNAFGDWLFVYGSTRSPDFPTVTPAQPNRVSARDGFVAIIDRTTFELLYSTYVKAPSESAIPSLVLNPVDGRFFVVHGGSGAVVNRFTPRATGNASRFGPQADDFDYDLVAFQLKDAWRRLGFSDEQFDELLGKLDELNFADCYEASRQFTGDVLVYIEEICIGNATVGASGPVRGAAVTPAQLERAVFVLPVPTCVPVAPSTTCRDRASLLFFDGDVNVLGSVNFGGQAAGREFLPTGVAIDVGGRVHIIGRTSDATLPVVSPVQGSLRGSTEGFVLTHNTATGETSFLSYLGGSGFDILADIAVDKDGNRSIVGDTLSADFPTTRGGLQPGLNGRIDGFVVKITP